ncbi:MAG: glucose 1-dehydrogenase [Deltaproteobacteria bacterium]|nr:glucose 1-dehydrogenase [Deltaproteobacteria bacterium]
MPTYDELRGKVVVVTGASRGIGRELALGFARAGASLVLASRKAAALESVAAEVRALGARAEVVPTHVGKADEARRLIAATVEKFGRIDVLVNNAATNPVFGPTVTADEAVWDKIFEVNVRGPFVLCRAAAEKMVAQGGGAIVNIASVAGIRPMMGLGIYGVSKAALIHLTKTLARELAPTIRVNAVAPGLVQTDFSRALLDDPDVRKIALGDVPLARPAAPAEIVDAVLFLACDASRYVTGEVVVVDGGKIV